MTPRFTGVDHIHLQVAQREEAENWYRSMLGFRRVERLMPWAVKSGPLTLEDADQRVHLALFEREAPVSSDCLALGTSGSDFLQWKATLESRGMRLRTADHDLAFSIYFRDPWGNQIEITTYDHAYVTERIGY